MADKKEQLLEKDLVLEEVSNLANRLRTQALEGREDTLELAKRVNDFQARIKGTTRRMMATVSELSMYQATAMKLTQENTYKDEQLSNMMRNLDEGMAPTEDIEREWLRYQLEMDRRGTEQYQQSVLQEMAPAQLTHTTAEPRPNAYIPDDIGTCLACTSASACLARLSQPMLSQPTLSYPNLSYPNKTRVSQASPSHMAPSLRSSRPSLARLCGTSAGLSLARSSCRQRCRRGTIRLHTALQVLQVDLSRSSCASRV